MLRRFLHFVRPHLFGYLAGFVLLLLTNALSLWIPWLLRDAIQAMQQGGALRAIAGYAGLMVGVAVLQAAVRTGSRLCILGASRQVVFDVRNEFFAHLQRLDGTFYDRERTGDIMSRGINDVQLLQSFYGPGVLNLLNTAIVYVAVLVLLLGIDLQLTLVSLLLYPPLFLAINRLNRRSYSRSLAVQEQLAALSGRVQENLSGMQQVKIYAQEQREIVSFREFCAEYRRRNLSMAALRGGMLSLIGATSGLATLVVLYAGGRAVVSGRIGFADFVAFHAYLALLAWPTIALGWILNTLQRGFGAMARIDEILFRASERDRDEAEPSTGAAKVLDGDIEIRGLTFRYPTAAPGNGAASERPALADVNLTIRRGSRVALVGAVGSGKSTLANLLVRFYPVPRRAISIGGVDINDIPIARLRGSIGYVPQEAFLFSRSLRENVALGRPDAPECDVVEAVRIAQLTRDLESFPAGLDTPVGERGYTLSGGQRQRATLARAILVRPRLLILDDALSSVDADTERAVLAELLDTSRERTLILITHRASALAAMDRVILFEEGRLVDEGRHAELTARCESYARLFRREVLEERLDS